MMTTMMMMMVTTMKILLALADMVDAIGNPESVVWLVLLVLLGKGCHLVPEEHSQYIKKLYSFMILIMVTMVPPICNIVVQVVRNWVRGTLVFHSGVSQGLVESA